MEQKILDGKFIPAFEGSISVCRTLHDHFVIFGKDGTIHAARSNNPHLKEGQSFFSFVSQEDTRRINELCNNFELQWLIIDTTLGCAAIYTSLYGISRLLFGIIFDSPKESVCRFFAERRSRSVNISPSIQALNDNQKALSQDARISETFEMAMSAFSYQQISEARYSLGANIGNFLAQRILSIADYIGCIGSCKTVLDFMPSLNDFSPEIFTIMSACAILFARTVGTDRCFQAHIDQYKERLLVSFRINVGEDFILYSNNKLSHELLRICERIALERSTFFDCSILDTSPACITLSFVLETDPLIGRRIKQDIHTLMSSFWN